MYCRNCGKQLNEDSNFCDKCGKEVLLNDLAPEDKTEKSSMSHYFANDDSEDSNLKFSKGATAWLCICVIVNGLVAIILFYSFLNKFDFNLERIYNQITRYESVLMEVLLPVCSLIMSHCFWQILRHKVRFPFYFTIGVGVFIFIYNMQMGVGFFAILGFINPVITYLALRKNWPYMPLK